MVSYFSQIFCLTKQSSSFWFYRLLEFLFWVWFAWHDEIGELRECVVLVSITGPFFRYRAIWYCNNSIHQWYCIVSIKSNRFNSVCFACMSQFETLETWHFPNYQLLSTNICNKKSAKNAFEIELTQKSAISANNTHSQKITCTKKKIIDDSVRSGIIFCVLTVQTESSGCNWIYSTMICKYERKENKRSTYKKNCWNIYLTIAAFVDAWTNILMRSNMLVLCTPHPIISTCLLFASYSQVFAAWSI